MSRLDSPAAVADRGYFSSPEILACHEAGVTVTLPKPQTSGAKSEGRDFAYLPEEDALSLSDWGAIAVSLYKRRRRQDAAALLDHSLSRLLAQIPMHDRARAADYANAPMSAFEGEDEPRRGK